MCDLRNKLAAFFSFFSAVRARCTYLNLLLTLLLTLLLFIYIYRCLTCATSLWLFRRVRARWRWLSQVRTLLALLVQKYNHWRCAPQHRLFFLRPTPPLLLYLLYSYKSTITDAEDGWASETGSILLIGHDGRIERLSGIHIYIIFKKSKVEWSSKYSAS